LAQALDLAPLLEEIQDLQARNKALKLRVSVLEARLEQRTQITKITYQERRSRFNQMQNWVLEIFLYNIPPTQGLAHAEIQAYFKKRHPTVSATYLPRRVAELVEKGELYRSDGPDRKARFFLKLQEENKEVSST
jgi:hypothetical protein